MINIISTDQYKTIPWKNGKGQTTELAISLNGGMDDFDWRLSIAIVVEDGLFSDFTGFERNLILLEGQGIKLIHDEKQTDLLDTPLSISSFNGKSKTKGLLLGGPIKDFNLMTRDGMYQVDVKAFIDQTEINIGINGLCFVYSHQNKVTISLENELVVVPIGHLVMVKDESTVEIVGKGFILIQLNC